jgi:hypothetical protein
MSAGDAPVPPQFLHLPILLKVGEAGLDRGHFVFGGEAAVPAPIAPNLGAAPYSPATFEAAPSSGSLVVNNVSGTSEYEGETGAASDGNTIVGAANHIFPGACSTSAASGAIGDCAPNTYQTVPGGAVVRQALPRTWNGTTFGIGFDPAVDYDKNGNYYVSYGVAPLSGSYPNAIVVVKGDGTAWAKTTPVTFNTSKNFDDKYYLAVDRSNTSSADRIYVAWDRNSANNQTLYVAYSSNGGTSWSAPVKVNDPNSRTERVIDAYPAVDHASGDVYVSWHDYARRQIFVDRSITPSGGAKWGKDVAAATTHVGFGTDIGCVGGRSQGPAHHLRVGPSGTLYLVYADSVTGRGYDILFTKSVDHGQHWSAPVSLNDDTGAAHQFHPTLAVTSNGAGGDTVTVTFYDRRDDPNNCLSDVYATQSTNSGTSWSANARLTYLASDFDGNPNGPGDYSSAAQYQATAWALFSGHPSGQPFDVYSAIYP